MIFLSNNCCTTSKWLIESGLEILNFVTTYLKALEKTRDQVIYKGGARMVPQLVARAWMLTGVEVSLEFL